MASHYFGPDGLKPIDGEQELPGEFLPRQRYEPSFELVRIISEAMSDEVWQRARDSSHRPDNVTRWWLDANARWNLAVAVAERIEGMIG